MGGDGQALTNKRSLMEQSRLYGVQRAVAEALDVAVASTHCGLTHAPLVDPIVCDLEGILYLKSAIVDFLIARQERKDALQGATDKEEEDSSLPAVRRLRDVTEVRSFVDGTLRCCVSGVTPSEQRPMGLCWDCGHVVALRAISSSSSAAGSSSKIPSTVACPHSDCVGSGRGEQPFVQLFLPVKAARVAMREEISKLIYQKPNKKKRSREDTHIPESST